MTALAVIVTVIVPTYEAQSDMSLEELDVVACETNTSEDAVDVVVSGIYIDEDLEKLDVVACKTDDDGDVIDPVVLEGIIELLDDDMTPSKLSFKTQTVVLPFDIFSMGLPLAVVY